MSTESCNDEDLSTTSSYTSAYSAYSNTNDDEIQQQQQQSKANISTEITNLKRHINSLVREHQELTSNKEYHTQQEHKNNEQSCGMNSIKDEILNTIYNIENQLNILYNTQQYIQDHSTQVTNIVKDKIHTELLIREEMESEMKELYSQKIIYEKEIHDLKCRLKDCTCSTISSCSDAQKKKSQVEEVNVALLKREIQTLRGENASLKNDLEELNDEIRSLSQCQPTTVVANADDNTPIQQQSFKSISQQEEEAASQQRIRALAQSQNSVVVVPRERFGSSVSGSTLEMIDGTTSVSIAGGRERLDTAGSAEDMNHVSLFDGQEETNDKNASIKPNDDHEGIRMHAEKLLFWANKATERSPARADGSTPFNTPQKIQPQQQQDLAAIPMSIGLPPRSQSRVVRNSSQLPPRCPSPNITTQVQVTVSASSSVSQDDVAVASINGMDTHSEELNDKENGGMITFNQKQEERLAVPGAFPKLKKNVSLSQHDIIINDYDNKYNNNDDMGYEECSTSPFTDHQSEFYLPQLGLASIEDRLSFSNNPTALSNILRPWQYQFLA